MSAWRRTALEMLPEFTQLISDADSPMALWIELLLEFQDAFEEQNASRVGKIVEYAKWCWRARDGDTVNAVACGFLEHLPEHEGMRARIPFWFSRAEFEELRQVFSYHAGNAVVAELEKKYRPEGR
jgi:hypothetical protein